MGDPSLQPLLLVIGQFEYLFDVARTAPESISNVESGDALLAPAQQATFDGPQPRRWLWRGTSWEVREYEHTLDGFVALRQSRPYKTQAVRVAFR